jgi:hypothetical protein
LLHFDADHITVGLAQRVVGGLDCQFLHPCGCVDDLPHHAVGQIQTVARGGDV